LYFFVEKSSIVLFQPIPEDTFPCLTVGRAQELPVSALATQGGFKGQHDFGQTADTTSQPRHSTPPSLGSNTPSSLQIITWATLYKKNKNKKKRREKGREIIA